MGSKRNSSRRLLVSIAVSYNEAYVREVNGSIVTGEVPQGEFFKNEVAYVCVGDARLKSEVLRAEGRQADLQLFEETVGVAVGDRVELKGRMLSATRGPGLLGAQSTLGTVKTFLGLSYDRAYKRFDPVIDPLISWSR
jgi:V/A-type H+-transporting ATPase subunit A